MQRIQRGNQDALMEIYARYSSSVYGLALHVVRTPQLAEEVTQDTFLKLWKQADRWQPEKGNLNTWLLTIARNTAIDVYRKVQRRARSNPFINIEAVDPGAIAVAGIHTDQWENGQILRRLLNQLPEEQAQVVELAYFQGMTHSQLAEALDLPLGTAKTRLRLAMQKLRVLWEASMGEAE